MGSLSFGRLTRAGVCALLTAAALPTAASGAQSETIHLDLPVTQVLVNPCIPEEIVVTGNLAIDTHVLTTDDGRLFFKHSISTAGSFKGSNLAGTSQYVYHSEEMVHNLDGTNVAEPPNAIYEHVIIHMIRQGETASTTGDDFFVHSFVEIRFDASGVPTIKTRFMADCR